MVSLQQRIRLPRRRLRAKIDMIVIDSFAILMLLINATLWLKSKASTFKSSDKPPISTVPVILIDGQGHYYRLVRVDRATLKLIPISVTALKELGYV